jgi:hypothetical protein
MSDENTIDMKEIDDFLDQYEQSVGLPTLKPVEAPECLSMSLEELRKKSPDELSEYAFLIGQYQLYIQRQINKNKAWFRWYKAKSDEYAAYYLKDASGYGQEKILQARNGPEICQKLNAFGRKIEMQLERLAFVPQNLESMANNIRDLKFSALRREKDGSNNND